MARQRKQPKANSATATKSTTSKNDKAQQSQLPSSFTLTSVVLIAGAVYFYTQRTSLEVVATKGDVETPQTTERNRRADHDGHQYVSDITAVPFVDGSNRDTTPVRPIPGKLLQRWDPVEHNFTRQLILDDTGRIYNMTTVALDPPIFEIKNFLSKEECEHIKKAALSTGFFKSDATFLDGSNKEDRNKDLNKVNKDEALQLFRYSDQTWLPNTGHKLVRSMQDRVMNLGLLPEKIRSYSEHMQVVRYSEVGHYESHTDSEPDHTGPCCIDPAARGFQTGVSALNQPLNKRCRLCRFMTVLYVLDDTEEGGETIFPLADTTDEEFATWERSTDPLKYKQTRACAPGKKVIPQLGKAIMWYNHKVDRGYLGPLDKRSLHGGCNVIKGKKWISNHWMSAIPHPDDPRSPATAHY